MAIPKRTTSQWKQHDYTAWLATSPEQLKEWLVPLVEMSASILHCSQRRFWEPGFPEIDVTELL